MCRVNWILIWILQELSGFWLESTGYDYTVQGGQARDCNYKYLSKLFQNLSSGLENADQRKRSQSGNMSPSADERCHLSKDASTRDHKTRERAWLLWPIYDSLAESRSLSWSLNTGRFRCEGRDTRRLHKQAEPRACPPSTEGKTRTPDHDINEINDIMT